MSNTIPVYDLQYVASLTMAAFVDHAHLAQSASAMLNGESTLAEVVKVSALQGSVSAKGVSVVKALSAPKAKAGAVSTSSTFTRKASTPNVPSAPVKG